jgi:hypothetical protein
VNDYSTTIWERGHLARMRASRTRSQGSQLNEDCYIASDVPDLSAVLQEIARVIGGKEYSDA